MSAGKIVITDRISIIDLYNLSIKAINIMNLIASNYHYNDIDRFCRSVYAGGCGVLKLMRQVVDIFYSLKS